MYEGQELSHAFGLCHYKNFLFWNEYRSGSIYKLDQDTKSVTLLRNERPPIFEIRMYDAQQQQGTDTNISLVTSTAMLPANVVSILRNLASFLSHSFF